MTSCDSLICCVTSVHYVRNRQISITGKKLETLGGMIDLKIKNDAVIRFRL